MSRIRIRPAGFDARPYRPSSLRAQARRNYERAAAADPVLRASNAPRAAYRAPDALHIRAAAGDDDLPLKGEGRPPRLVQQAEAGGLGSTALQQRNASAITPAPTLPLSGGGSAHAPAQQQHAGLTPLTLQVQDLYENSAVPVRDIARLVGVHQRTLYKYVQKYRWRRRYNIPGVAEKPKPPQKPSRFTLQPRGTGGRFVARERASAPALHGLKALDPAAAARAAAACARAKEVSDAAAARARRLREKLSHLRALILLLRAARDLAAVAAAQKTRAARRAARAAAAAERHEDLRRSLAAKLDALAAEAAAAPAQNASAPAAPEASAPPAPPSPRIRAL
jgi:hypothetical protein